MIIVQQHNTMEPSVRTYCLGHQMPGGYLGNEQLHNHFA